MASFDVKSLFTNVPVKGAMRAIELAIKDIPTEEFTLPKPHFLKLVELCLDFQAFSFGGEEFAQVNGLAMGSPLSPVAACLYLETLEKEHFEEIMGPETTWLRYIDDVFLLVPNETDLEEKLNQLNEVEERIQFTLEKENNGTLPFLDVMIMKCQNSVKYKVYRKKTNQEDYVHYLSAHSERVKSGIVISFFLRALRICSDEFLEPEITHIFEVFKRLRYPKAFIIRCLRKAKKIRDRPRDSARRRNSEKLLVVPNSKQTLNIARSLRSAGIKLVESAGTKISDIIKKKSGSTNEDSIVYRVPCGGCTRSYLGETYRGLQKRVGEHKRDIRNHISTSSFVIHVEEYQHLPNWERSEILWKGQGKSRRKLIESAVIETLPNINSKRGDFTLSSILANIVWGDLRKMSRDT